MNKRQILIILIILLVLGFSVWNNNKMKGNVSIITDKLEYEKEEALKINISNNLQRKICFSSCYPYFLEKKNGEWKSYLYDNCHEKNLSETCIDPFAKKAFEIILSNVENGSHRITIPICFGCDEGNNFKEKTRLYSNEFTIKEKEEILDITTWQTLTNQRNSFEIKYPKDWRVESHELSESCAGCVDLYEFEPSNIKITIGGSMTWNVAKSNLEQEIDGKSEEIVIAGTSAIKREGKTTKYSTLTLEGTEVKEIILMKPNEIIFHFFTVEQEENIFDQMLSTFRFLE